MKGLELSEQYFETYGRQMLEREFPALLPYLAAGLCGSGSECLGYDDAVSRDHDFEPGFCIFIAGSDEEREDRLPFIGRQSEFQLSRAYGKLPGEFLGLKRSYIQPSGGRRMGVIRADAFFTERCGHPRGELSLREWLRVPEQLLLEACSGKIFHDPSGLMTEVRERLSRFPEDIRRKKAAGALVLMKQSGLYNCPRAIGRGEGEAARLEATAFIKAAAHLLFLLHSRYMPYDKWLFRALRELPGEAAMAGRLSAVFTADENALPALLAGLSEDLTRRAAEGFGLAPAETEALAFQLNDSVSSAEIRALHILSGT